MENQFIKTQKIKVYVYCCLKFKSLDKLDIFFGFLLFYMPQKPKNRLHISNFLIDFMKIFRTLGLSSIILEAA